GRERVVEAVKQLRRELEPYVHDGTLGGREHELILFKTGERRSQKQWHTYCLRSWRRGAEVRESLKTE
ncbi:hypothetical protein, partial [Pyrobaculum aerophilum]